MANLTSAKFIGVMRGLVKTVSLFLTVLLLAGLAAAQTSSRFDRTYTPRDTIHLTISNVNGDVTVAVWDKRTVSVRATAASPVRFTDNFTGNEISIGVSPSPRPAKAQFLISIPAGTSISIDNMMGRIEISGVSGHIRVSSFDSHVHLTGIRAPSIDVRVTSGDIHFEGELQREGVYSFQSIKGDIDITLPRDASFQLKARALSANINLGDFVSNLSGLARGPRGVSGTHLTGGPRLTVTTYSGRILFHRK